MYLIKNLTKKVYILEIFQKKTIKFLLKENRKIYILKYSKKLFETKIILGINYPSSIQFLNQFFTFINKLNIFLKIKK